MQRWMRAMYMAMGLLAGSVFAAPPKAVGTPEDKAAIEAVIQDFQSSLKSKDMKKLSSLMLHSNILWASPVPDKLVSEIRRDTDPNFDGVRAGGFNDFVLSVKNDKKSVEEKFYDVKITQDRDVAWVLFDYEFLSDGVVQNYGVEAWQMVKREGKWKIFSVTWSANFVD